MPRPAPFPSFASVEAFIKSATTAGEVKAAHALAVVTSALPTQTSTLAALILAYSAHGHFPTARALFRRSPPPPTAFLHNTFIRACTASSSYAREAFAAYNAIFLGRFCRPDDHTFPFILKACADTAAVDKGLEVHATVVKLGFAFDVFVNNTLITYYCASGSGCLNDARKVFDEMPERDVITWNSIISCLSDRGCFREALIRFLGLISDGNVEVNHVSLVSVLPACAMIGDECAVKGIHGFAVKTGLDSEVNVCNAFVDVYGKCGNVGDAMRVFYGIVVKSVV